MNGSISNNDKQATPEDLNTRQPGLTGKLHWPIRIGSFLLFAATVAIVYVFGMRNNEVSNKYYLYVTPPGLFFTIWAVIFVLKGIVNIINLILNVWTLKAHIFLAINNLLLILWTNIFNISNDPAVYVSFLIIFALIPTTLLFWYAVGDIKPIDWFTYFTRNTYAFYLGWVVAATNVNFGILIVYWWKADPRTQLIIFWIMAPLSAIGITALNVYKQGLYGLKSCFALWISVIWAFVGAAITSARCYPNGCMAP